MKGAAGLFHTSALILLACVLLGALFRPFRQVDSGTMRNCEGTGLGLSICKRLLELLGERIQMESAVGEGSTFTFVLPLDGRKP